MLGVSCGLMLAEQQANYITAANPCAALPNTGSLRHCTRAEFHPLRLVLVMFYVLSFMSIDGNARKVRPTVSTPGCGSMSLWFAVPVTEAVFRNNIKIFRTTELGFRVYWD